ncbi:MAG: AAA family ATPase [Spirochaetales bacterium]|nr:AAA family ATPase [Spirochaetales bacterium]
MVRSELNKRGPLRVFEKSINGGLGKGHIGVLASKKGVGKTACLVHIATDKLFRGRHVIHVSFSQKVDHIINWYEDIFKEIAKKRDLEDAVDIHDEIIKNRVIMNFNSQGTTIDQVLKSLSAMMTEGHFPADSVIFDGYKLAEASPEDLDKLKSFAKEANVELWFSVSLNGESPTFNKDGVPTVLLERLKDLDVLITLKYEGDHVHFQVIKDHENLEPKDMTLKLDPKTMLIARE